MHIDDVLASVALTGPTTFTAEIGEDWGQGRTLFGGIQALIAVGAMRLAVPDAPPLWSLQTTFIAPVPPGRISGTVETLRAGRSAMQLEVRLMVEGQCACLLVGVFGAARSSSINVAPPQAIPPAVTIDAAPELPYIPGIVPEFTRHYAYRLAEGGLPFSASKVQGTRTHLRQRDDGLLTEAHIVALADAIPPPTFSLLDKPSPASSLTWTLEFVRHLPPTPTADWWRMDARIVSARDGYSSQDAYLHGPDGELVALSRQVVALFG